MLDDLCLGNPTAQSTRSPSFPHLTSPPSTPPPIIPGQPQPYAPCQPRPPTPHNGVNRSCLKPRRNTPDTSILTPDSHKNHPLEGELISLFSAGVTGSPARRLQVTSSKFPVTTQPPTSLSRGPASGHRLPPRICASIILTGSNSSLVPSKFGRISGPLRCQCGLHFLHSAALPAQVFLLDYLRRLSHAVSNFFSNLFCWHQCLIENSSSPDGWLFVNSKATSSPSTINKEHMIVARAEVQVSTVRHKQKHLLHPSIDSSIL